MGLRQHSGRSLRGMLGCLIFGAVPGKAVFANNNNKALFPGSSREEGYIVFCGTASVRRSGAAANDACREIQAIKRCRANTRNGELPDFDRKQESKPVPLAGPRCREAFHTPSAKWPCRLVLANRAYTIPCLPLFVKHFFVVFQRKICGFFRVRKCRSSSYRNIVCAVKCCCIPVILFAVQEHYFL